MQLKAGQSSKKRQKVVLTEECERGKWLATQLGKTGNVISRRVHNINRPPIEQRFGIAIVLNVDVKSLLNSNNE